MQRSFLQLSLLVAVLSSSLFAAQTTITDNVYAIGNIVGDRILKMSVTSNAFTAADNTSVSAATTNVTVASTGAFSVALSPNAGTTGIYTVTYKSASLTYTEFLAVPVSASPIILSQARAQGALLAASNGMYYLLPGVSPAATGGTGGGSLGYTPLNPANNLSDVSSTSAALANLGGVSSSALSGTLKASNNLSDVSSASTALSNLGGVTSSALTSGLAGKQNSLGYTPLNPANNLSDVSNATTALANIVPANTFEPFGSVSNSLANLTNKGFAVDTGTANNYVVTLSGSPSYTGGVAGAFFFMKASSNGTAGGKVAINGGAQITMLSTQGSTLGTNDIAANQVYMMYDNGANIYVSAMTGGMALRDSSLLFINSTTSNKAFRFNASNLSAGNTRVITIPDTQGTMDTGSSESPTFSSTPTFKVDYHQSYFVLTGNVTTFTLAAGVDGQEKALTFCQNATGGFTVTPPSNVRGFTPVGTTASKCSSQHFTYSSSQVAWLADTPGVINQ